MSKLSKKDVEYIAKLSRLELCDAEKEKFANQLSLILKYMELLNEVNTTNIEPTAQVSGLSNIFREDEVKKSTINKKDIEENAPQFENGSFRVPSVFDGGN